MNVQYPEVDPIELDECGEYYTRHLFAMTNENLHGKGEIAAQLGARDLRIDQLEAQLKEITANLLRIENFTR